VEAVQRPDKLPATYDAWLQRAEQVENQLQSAGLAVARIRIRPVPFAAWCKERNVSPDQAARPTFACSFPARIKMPAFVLSYA
jgi:hypothetical protein